MIDTSIGFTLEREFPATPEELWRCWTEPSEATHWLHPRGVSTPEESIRFDVREGGRYEYTMVNDTTGERYPTVGVYRQVEPYERLVFTWGNPGDDPDDCPVITVAFEPTESGTRMTFELVGVPGGDIYEGWAQALDCLAEHVSADRNN